MSLPYLSSVRRGRPPGDTTSVGHRPAVDNIGSSCVRDYGLTHPVEGELGGPATARRAGSIRPLNDDLPHILARRGSHSDVADILSGRDVPQQISRKWSGKRTT